MQTRNEIQEAILDGDRHPVFDADGRTVEGLEWVSFNHEASDGGHVSVEYSFTQIESWDGEEPTPTEVYPDG